jgi:hypothetical protein
MTQTKKLIIASLGAVATVSALAIIPASAAPVNNPWNQTVQVSSTDVITIDSTVGGNAIISADPSVSDGFATAAVPITVSSNNPAGYSLTLSMISTDANSGQLWNATAATGLAGIAAGPTALTANTWGYNLDSSANFSAVPASSSAATLIAPTGTFGSTSITVTYGAQVDYTLPANTIYSNQVTYTASAQ